MMSKQNINYAAAFPTFPIQDKLGQTIVNFGMSRIEFAAITLAAGWWQHSGLLPETIAQEAVTIAEAIFTEIDTRSAQQEANENKIISLNGGGL